MTQTTSIKKLKLILRLVKEFKLSYIEVDGLKIQATALTYEDNSKKEPKENPKSEMEMEDEVLFHSA